MQENEFGSIRNNGHSEITSGHLLYKLDCYLGNNINIKLSDFDTNCNKLLIDRLYPNNPTNYKITCLPLQILEDINTEFNFCPNYNQVKYNLNPLEKKELLYRTLTQAFSNLNLIGLQKFNHITKFPIEWFFKSPILSQPSQTSDFKYLTKDDMLGDIFSQEKNRLKVSKSSGTFKSSWLRKSELYSVTSPLCYKTRVGFIGFCKISESDSINNMVSEVERSDFFNPLKKALKNKDIDAIAFYIHYQGHWKAVVFDKPHSILCFYASEGTVPGEWPNISNLFFYSYDSGTKLYVDNPKENIDYSEIKDLIALIKIFIQEDKNTKVLINLEKSQIASGECGIFSLMFIYLMVQLYQNNYHSTDHNLKEKFVSNNIKLRPLAKELTIPYNFYKYAGDSKMALYRNLWFADFDFDLKVCDIKKKSKLFSLEKKAFDELNSITKKMAEEIDYFK